MPPKKETHPIWKTCGGPMKKAPDNSKVECKWVEDGGQSVCTWTQNTPKNGYPSVTNLVYHVTAAHSNTLPVNYGEFEKKLIAYKKTKEQKAGGEETAKGSLDAFVTVLLFLLGLLVKAAAGLEWGLVGMGKSAEGLHGCLMDVHNNLSEFYIANAKKQIAMIRKNH